MGWRRIGQRVGAGLFWGIVFILGAHLALIILFRWCDVPVTAFMIRAQQQGHTVQYRWTDWQQMAPSLPMAVMAAEDQRFPIHWGFDVTAIAKAVKANRTRRRPRGASTITQQTAKNLFFWPGRNWIRKGMEAYTTVLLEVLWPKQRILEVYLNVAQFGPNVFGVGAASAVYYKRSPMQLTLADASHLAAVMPNPYRLSAARPSYYVFQRAGEIERLVSELGGPEQLGQYLAGEAWVFQDPPVRP